MNDLTKNILVFIVIIVVLLSVVQGLSGVSGGQPSEVPYNVFWQQVESNQVKYAEIGPDRVKFGNTKAMTNYTNSPESDNNALIDHLLEHGVEFSATEKKQQSLIGQLLITFAAEKTSGGRFAERIETLLAAVLDQPGTRLPGSRRLEARATAARDGLRIGDALHRELSELAAAA